MSKEEYDAIRQSEEQGSLGKAWEAIKDDPWGTLAMGRVVAAGVGLLFVPGGQAFGVGILIGVGTSAAAGLATGTFDPRQVAFSGVLGGITGGVGAATSSVGAAAASGAVLGGAGDLGSQMIAGRGIDWRSVAVSTGIGAVTGGVGEKFEPAVPALTGRPTMSTISQSTVNGAVLGGGGEFAKQALTGDGSIDPRTIMIQAAGGGAPGRRRPCVRCTRRTDHVLGAIQRQLARCRRGRRRRWWGSGWRRAAQPACSTTARGDRGRAPSAGIEGWRSRPGRHVWRSRPAHRVSRSRPAPLGWR